jgi:hypothetical protein
MRYELQERDCPGGCGRKFKVLPQSTQVYCSKSCQNGREVSPPGSLGAFPDRVVRRGRGRPQKRLPMPVMG